MKINNEKLSISWKCYLLFFIFFRYLLNMSTSGRKSFTAPLIIKNVTNFRNARPNNISNKTAKSVESAEKKMKVDLWTDCWQIPTLLARYFKL